jgi:hypothetical protein
MLAFVGKNGTISSSPVYFQFSYSCRARKLPHPGHHFGGFLNMIFFSSLGNG